MARKSGVVKETSEKVVKKIPSSDNGPGVSCKTKNGQHYQISQNLERMKFTLWKVIDGGFIKIATANSPLDLDDLIPWNE